MASTLITHCGAFKYDREEVINIPTPRRTDSWEPIAHKAIIERVLSAAENSGLEVVRESYALSGKPDMKSDDPEQNKFGREFFAVIDFSKELGSDEFHWSIGVRNSHSKKFAAGCVAGARVTVCDNLLFKGDKFTLTRKHTRGSHAFLGDLETGFTELPGQMDVLYKRIEELKKKEISEENAKIKLFDAGLSGLYPSGRMFDAYQEWIKPRHEEFAHRNEFTLLMAATEIAKQVGATKDVIQTYQRIANVFKL